MSPHLRTFHPQMGSDRDGQLRCRSLWLREGYSDPRTECSGDDEGDRCCDEGDTWGENVGLGWKRSAILIAPFSLPRSFRQCDAYHFIFGFLRACFLEQIWCHMAEDINSLSYLTWSTDLLPCRSIRTHTHFCPGLTQLSLRKHQIAAILESRHLLDIIVIKPLDHSFRLGIFLVLVNALTASNAKIMGNIHRQQRK